MSDTGIWRAENLYLVDIERRVDDYYPVKMEKRRALISLLSLGEHKHFRRAQTWQVAVFIEERRARPATELEVNVFRSRYPKITRERPLVTIEKIDRWNTQEWDDDCLFLYVKLEESQEQKEQRMKAIIERESYINKSVAAWRAKNEYLSFGGPAERDMELCVRKEYELQNGTLEQILERAMKKEKEERETAARKKSEAEKLEKERKEKEERLRYQNTPRCTCDSKEEREKRDKVYCSRSGVSIPFAMAPGYSQSYPDPPLCPYCEERLSRVSQEFRNRRRKEIDDELDFVQNWQKRFGFSSVNKRDAEEAYEERKIKKAIEEGRRSTLPPAYLTPSRWAMEEAGVYSQSIRSSPESYKLSKSMDRARILEWEYLNGRKWTKSSLY